MVIGYWLKVNGYWLRVVYNDSQAKLATKYDSRQRRYEIGFRFSSLPSLQGRVGVRLLSRDGAG